MLKVPLWGTIHEPNGRRGAGDAARDLVELLTGYEEELMAFERDTLAPGLRRRVVGMALAVARSRMTGGPESRADDRSPGARGWLD